ncbi:MAG: DEAD/DEAH box helicase family protein, partial [Puniceicoccales bacterium]|nr:DEAD/DEAH box helicase family protein [Puniceicoccales bacterium]
MQTDKPPPRYPGAELAEMTSWATVRAARTLSNSISGCTWEFPNLSGAVEEGQAIWHPRIDFRSQSLPRNHCDCPVGKKQQLCVHSLALYFHYQDQQKSIQTASSVPKKSTESVKKTEVPATPAPLPEKITSLVLSSTKGIPLSFRLLLPPNIAQSANADGIPLKLDALVSGKVTPPEYLDRGRAYALPPEFEKLIASLEQWCGGRLHGLLRLKRAQLLFLLENTKDVPWLAWANKPEDSFAASGQTAIASLIEQLRRPPPEPEPAKPTETARPAAKTRNTDDTAPMQVEGSPQYLKIELPGRDHPNYNSALDLLKLHKFQLDPSTRSWWLRDKHRVLNFLAEYQARLVSDYGAQFSPGFLQRTAHFVTAQLKAEAEERNNGTFDLSIHIDAQGADEGSLRTALARNQSYVESADGKIVLLPPPLIQQVTNLTKKLTQGEAGSPAPRLARTVPASELADIEGTLEDAAVSFVAPETWKQRSQALRNLSALQQAPCSDELRSQLRLYQQIGTAWLWHLFKNKLGGVLADEMGLGKTVQAIAFLDAVNRTQEQQTEPDKIALVVCPAALVENWCRELIRFAPHLRIHRHHGASRPAAIDANGIDLVVTSYGTLTRDIEIFHDPRWSVIIADEAQHIKNRRSQNARSLRQLRADGRFVLTGTPIENSLDDLRSLFDFLMPGYIARPPADFSREERTWYDQRTREKAALYILRRTKQAVAPELPEKIEQTVFCELEGSQASLYQTWQERTRAEIFNLEMGGASENRVRMAAFNQLLRLRQICAEPRLLQPELSSDDSAKLRALREILDEAIDGGHRILLFSQFVEVLQHLRRELDEES